MPLASTLKTAGFALAALVGFAQAALAEGYIGAKYLTTVAELQTLLQSDKVRVYDLRKADAYAKGHIPGAAHFDRANIVTSARFSGEFIGPEAAGKVFSEAGFGNEHTIVLYHEGQPLADATYTFWALDSLGHEDVRVLDGGLEAWTAAGLPLATEATTHAAASFVPRRDPQEARSIDDVKSKLGAEKVDFVHGGQSYVNGLLPASNSYHFTPADLFNGAYLKPQAEVDAIVTALGLAKDRETVTYCGNGSGASVFYWGLKVAGYEKVSLYSDSVAGWTHDGGALKPVTN